ncbi:MAG: hypothetical protein Q8R53_02715, partial [Nanoarchaeota archaeon]|nr:hypothetical protein [Nanoarchaeota archaeon]
MAKYFTADWHLNERRIGDCNLYFRPFKTVEEQNRTIINNMNDVVQPDDELYIVGDAVIDNEGVDLLEKINCRNRILIVGNHDEKRLDRLQKHFKEIHESLDVRVGDVACHLNHYPLNHVSDRFNIV